MATRTLNIHLALMGLLCLPACGSPGSEPGDATGAGVSSTTPTSDVDSDDEDTDDSSSGTDDTNADSDMTCGFFIDMDDDVPCGTQCDIWNPDDCVEGEKCTSVACAIGGNSWDSNVCRPINGEAAAGDECMYTDGSGVSGNDTCGAGTMCWNADADTGLGTCIAFCTGSPDTPSCAAGTSCAILNDGTLPICLPSCDPLAQDCEASNELCLPDPSGTGYICALDASGQMAPYGTPCNYANSCNAGLICGDPAGVPEPDCASAGGCCTPMCAISGPAQCPGEGQSCEPVFDPQPPGFEDVGYCTIAM